MKILLLSATEMEIKQTLDAGLAIDALVAGVGVPATIYALMEKLQNNRYDLVIQAGIGGSFTGMSMHGEVVAITEDCFADLGIEEKGSFSNIFDMGFADLGEFPFTGGWLINPAIPGSVTVRKARSITINKITDEERQVTLLKNKYNAEVESMEGAALHYVCLQQKIPFLQLRAISNTVGERDKTKWKMAEAIKNLNASLQQVIKDLL